MPNCQTPLFKAAIKTATHGWILCIVRRDGESRQVQSNHQLSCRKDAEEIKHKTGKIKAERFWRRSFENDFLPFPQNYLGFNERSLHLIWNSSELDWALIHQNLKWYQCGNWNMKYFPFLNPKEIATVRENSWMQLQCNDWLYREAVSWLYNFLQF